MLQNSENATRKVRKLFECKLCDYNTCRKSQYERHIITPKHLNAIKLAKNVEGDKSQKKYSCDFCNTQYHHYSSMHRHKKNCSKRAVLESEGSFLKKLIKQNEKLILENNEFKTLMMDFLKNPPKQETVIHHTENTMMNSNNKQFNLQFFLNETCKNAMNITDFVDSLEIKSNELEDLGKLGYVQGISNIFIRGLKELDETERPLHCTDKKRETLYTKECDNWEKEDVDKSRVKKIVKEIAHKNFKRIPDWKEANPLSEDSSSKKHIEYMQILNQVMTGITPEDDAGINKIIKKVAQEVYIDK